MHPDRGPIIIDLGIARSEDSVGLTNTGVVIGSPGFMAPEQIQGFRIDPRADLFVLGIILYFCLVGKSPYGEGQTVAIVYRVVYNRIDVSDLPISAEFRQVIARATELKADNRFQNADEFQKGIEGTPEWQSYQGAASRHPTTIIRTHQRNMDTIE